MAENILCFFRFEDDLNKEMAIKIWSGNVVQCSMAFVGLYYGYRTSIQASNNEKVFKLSYQVALEAYYGFFKEFDVKEDDLLKRANNAVAIFKNTEFADDLF